MRSLFAHAQIMDSQLTQSREITCDGVVLHMRPFGDSHRIIDVLTAEFGRLPLLARGARASRKRFGGILDVFAGLRLHIKRGRGLWTLEAADVQNLRFDLRQDLERLQAAYALC